MDEPTASLDFGNQAVVLRQVRRLRASGLDIVLSTHDPDHAFAAPDLADSVQPSIAKPRVCRPTGM